MILKANSDEREALGRIGCLNRGDPETATAQAILVELRRAERRGRESARKPTNKIVRSRRGAKR